jgi:type II secretory pathway component GspD/PulD (secretin)
MRPSPRILPIIVLSALLPAGAQFDSMQAESPGPVIASHGNPRLKTPISLIAKDASLSDVLKVLAERSGMNFVSGEGVYKEKITIILNKTPLDEAVNILVRAAGLSYEIIGNSVLIAEPDKLKEEVGLMSYVVDLKYAPAAEVAGMLSDITAKVKVDEGGNRLVCYSSPRVIGEIEKVVQAIDHPHILILLETRLIEVSLDNLHNCGIDWSALSPITSGIIIPEGNLASGISLDSWTRLPSDFNLILDLLSSKGKAKMLMNSRLTTTNNHEANLLIGDQIPYTIQTYNLSGSGGGVNLQIQKEEVGVKMRMIPHVNEDSQVTLTLEPEVSSIIGWKGPGGELPLVRVRRTQTTVRVENGQTVFLAGLLQEEKTTEIRKVPVLGDIPILGVPFQHVNTRTKKTNLIIEITPWIIIAGKKVPAGTADLEAMEKEQKSLENQIK